MLFFLVNCIGCQLRRCQWAYPPGLVVDRGTGSSCSLHWKEGCYLYVATHLHPCWWSWSTLSILSTWLHCPALVSHNLECYPDDVSRDVSHETMDWPTELIMAQHTHTHTHTYTRTGGTPKSPAVERPLHVSFWMCQYEDTHPCIHTYSLLTQTHTAHTSHSPHTTNTPHIQSLEQTCVSSHKLSAPAPFLFDTC